MPSNKFLAIHVVQPGKAVISLEHFTVLVSSLKQNLSFDGKLTTAAQTWSVLNDMALYCHLIRDMVIIANVLLEKKIPRFRSWNMNPQMFSYSVPNVLVSSSWLLVLMWQWHSPPLKRLLFSVNFSHITSLNLVGNSFITSMEGGRLEKKESSFRLCSSQEDVDFGIIGDRRVKLKRQHCDFKQKAFISYSF